MTPWRRALTVVLDRDDRAAAIATAAVLALGLLAQATEFLAVHAAVETAAVGEPVAALRFRHDAWSSWSERSRSEARRSPTATVDELNGRFAVGVAPVEPCSVRVGSSLRD